MTPDAIDRQLESRLAGLPAMPPDPAHAERIRARCHAQLARRINRSQVRRRVFRRVVAPALVGSFCLVYVVLLLYDAFRVHWRPGL